ncbi:DNA topoisomerase 2-beta [Dermatophagoides farinae]|uniref:DNA topoisomerase (ATP-hydrolyzing) n=1 Tax=Dermatophagoides farinae TaxID=6954 RepID=A0A922HUL2_DERFA|nr:DNA topoisomerase 2-beta [Dermatophagoides farinae]
MANKRTNSEAFSNQHEKKPDIEEIYQKKSSLEHILLFPKLYIGSVDYRCTWIHVNDRPRLLRHIEYVPGLYKIFKEILANAAHNKIRDPKMNLIRIDIDSANNEISVYNNGCGIPVYIHKDENLYLPTLLFGHLFTSNSNRDRAGLGAKLCNIFSTMFKIETSSKKYNSFFSQVWKNNMKTVEEIIIRPANDEDFTRVTFKPDLAKFNMTHLDEDIVYMFKCHAQRVSKSLKDCKVSFNGQDIFSITI